MDDLVKRLRADKQECDEAVAAALEEAAEKVLDLSLLEAEMGAWNSTEDREDSVDRAEEYCKSIRALIPFDATAALAARDRRMKAEGMRMAADITFRQEEACVEWYQKTRNHANVYEQLAIVTSEILTAASEMEQADD